MQIKRFVASSLAALMAGATFAGAALAATSVGGVLKTLGSQAVAGTPYLVVVGDTAAASDVVGAIDVASALAQQVTKEVAVPGVSVATLTGGVSLDTADTKLYLGDVVGKAKNTLTSNDLPTLLASGSVEDEGGTKYEYSQYLSFPTSSPSGTNTYAITYDQEYVGGGLKDPVYKIILGTSQPPTNYLVRAWVSFNKPLNASKAVGKEIKLFGKSFTISSETDNTKLVLFGVSGKETIQAGESKTITVGGVSHTVKVIGVIDSKSAVIEVDGVQKEVVEGNTYDFAGTSVYVSDVFYVKVPQETGYVVVSIGADRYVLQQGYAIKQGSSGNEVEIKGTKVATLDPQNLSTLEIYFDGYSSDTGYIKAGSAFTVPVFGFKVAYNGPASIPSETITISPGGTSYYQLSFTDKFGKSGTITWAYHSNSGDILADSNGDEIAVVEGTPLQTATGGYHYTIVNAGGFPHMLKVTSSDVTQGSSGQYPDKCTVEFQDVLSGTTYKFEKSDTMIDGKVQGTLVIDGQSYTVACDGTQSPNIVTITWSSTGKVVFPTLETKYGAKIALTKDVQVFNDLGNSWVKVSLPSGDVWMKKDSSTENTIDIDYNGDATTDTTVTSSGTITVGGVVYALSTTSGSDVTIMVDKDQNSSTVSDGLTVPAVLLIEEKRKDESISHVAIFPVQYDSSSGEQRLELGGGATPIGIWVDGQPAISTSSDKVTHYVTKWGTKVVYDTTGAGTATITYPDSQVYHLVAVGENPSWTTTATEAGTYSTYAPLSLPVARLASEVTDADKANANFVLVGGPCVNTLMEQLYESLAKKDTKWSAFTCPGGPGYAGPAWTSGRAYIQVIEDAFATGKIALLIAGTEAADTRTATDMLSKGQLATETRSEITIDTVRKIVVS
jgi:hypothetical protein